MAAAVLTRPASASRDAGGLPVERLEVAAFTIPTDAPEADGTLHWDATTIVVVQVHGGGQTGIGYTYADISTARLVASKLRDLIEGADALSPPSAWERMRAAVRNLGRPGICSTAISAVDVALWDLKARVLGLPLATLLGVIHDSVPIYGSGGFTTYSDGRLADQLRGWVDAGINRVKIKIGGDRAEAVRRAGVAREAIGREPELFVDANGAYAAKPAIALGEALAGLGVTWFEEPVSSDDLRGLRLVRERLPASIEVAAGEYGYDLFSFRRMLDCGAVDVLQADVTRCGGITELLRVGALCAAAPIPFSAHTAPAIHAHACCAIPTLVHLEYFHDHTRIERMIFDGVLEPADGALAFDRSRPGLGLELRRADAERYAA